ncbi:hypothetical protein CSKR_109936 [Clonorchis sinensis]|uniref:Uncharacterized protein n=1 Tax=Clonorchis sinensis TaxID=79923 RepID=A0A419QD23_CLOSI|nr:hypothetical protein CSKR_109936 [Clonorchis sinensis]
MDPEGIDRPLNDKINISCFTDTEAPQKFSELDMHRNTDSAVLECIIIALLIDLVRFVPLVYFHVVRPATKILRVKCSSVVRITVIDGSGSALLTQYMLQSSRGIIGGDTKKELAPAVLSVQILRIAHEVPLLHAAVGDWEAREVSDHNHHRISTF